MEEVNARLGETFEIVLESYGTTGHLWKSVKDDTVFESLGEKTIALNPDSIGGSGQSVFAFKPLVAGEFTIAFELVRPWKPDKPAMRREFLVRVVA